jgi:polysaccharide biosynthesis transport protein
MATAQPHLPAPRDPGYLAKISDGALAIHGAAAHELVEYEPLISVQSILRALFRNRYLILAVFAVCLGIGLASILLLPRTYESTSRVLVGEQTPSPLPNTSQPSSPPVSSQEVDRLLQTQVDLLATRDMANEVLTLLNRHGGQAAQVAAEYSPDDLQDAVTVYLPRSSRVISISYDDRNPNTAAWMANAYAAALIERNLQTKYNAAEYSRQFLQQQLGLTKGRLELSERALIAYAKAAGIVDATSGMTATGSDPNGTQEPKSLTTANLVQLNAAYAQAQSNRIQAQQKWEQAQVTPLMSLPDVLTNPAIQQLNQQKALAQAALEQNRQRYKEGHPLVQQAEANIAELDRQIQTIAMSVKNSLQDQYEVAARQESALAGGVGALKNQTLAEQDRTVQYNVLQREVETNRELYDALLQRYKQVSAEAGMADNSIAVVDEAYPADFPISPKPIKNMSLAFGGATILAFVLVFLRERLDHRVGEPERIGREVAIPLLAVIPKVKGSDGPAEALLDSNSPLSEACHSLRTAIELGCDGATPGSILFTSSRAEEGKTTTALGLAHAFAQAGKRVLLVDGDIRRPSLHQPDGVSNDVGFTDVISGRVALADAINSSEAFGVDLLTSGARPESPAALLDPETVKGVLDSALHSYDYVIVDGPPTMGLADATRLAAAADATIFVVKSEGVTKEEARFALSRLQSQQSRVIGAVLTMFEAHRSLSSHYYRYGYAASAN